MLILLFILIWIGAVINAGWFYFVMSLVWYIWWLCYSDDIKRE